MWNTALIFSNKNHGMQKKLFMEKIFFFCILRKNYWITFCAHMAPHEYE